jgi:hypothetical protein
MTPVPKIATVPLALKRRGTVGIVAAVAAASLALAAPVTAGAPTAGITPAGTVPVAGKSAETLVAYLTVGKLKPGRRIAYRVVCNADCQLTATSTLVLKGPNLGPISSTGSFPAGVVAEAFLKPNKPARAAIKRNIGASKLRTSVTATAVATGETDTDKRTFRFKGKKKKK